MSDRDGNSYRTVQLGDHVWMAENFRGTTYSDGASIPSFVYDGEDPDVSIYGRLYRFAAALRTDASPGGAQGACPDEWHVPSDAEWQELIDDLGGEDLAGGKVKEAGLAHWLAPNTGATNESLLTFVGAGWFDFTGVYEGRGETEFLRTSQREGSAAVTARVLRTSLESLRRGTLHPNDAIPLRCVRD